MTIQEIEQELFEMERKLKSMFNSCSQDLAIGIDKLRGELAELKESKKENSGKWKPKSAEEYWFRNTDKGEIESVHRYEGDGWDDWRVKNIPIFKTEEECTRYWYFMDTVKEKSYEFSKEEWENGNIIKHYVYYDYGNGTFDVYSADVGRSFGKFYFKTEASAQYIIDNFKDELKEYWI